MTAEQAVLIFEELDKLLEEGDRQRLRLLMNEQHPQDLAPWLTELDKQKRLSLFRLLDLDNASSVLAELEPKVQSELLKDIGDFGVVPIISKMSPDDAVDLLSELPRDKVRSIINQITDLETAQDLQQLMTFKDDTAGGIMSTDFVCILDNLTIGESLEYLRQSLEKTEEDLYDVYVTDAENKLVGKITLKELLTAPPEALVESQMDTNVVLVTADVDQEEAAEKLAHYDLLSLPVVDVNGCLQGIITADDILDVIQEEAAEDLFQSSGINVSESETTESLVKSVPLAFQARLPWLVVTLLVETLSASVIGHFDQVIRQTVVAASFMPLLTGVTGSVATQSTCIVIASGSTSQDSFKIVLRHIAHEIQVGMLLGTACALITCGLSFLLHSATPILGIVVGFSLFLTMTFGVILGTLMPLLFQRIGIEPSHASGPLLTSTLDVCTMSIYLSIVHTVLSQLV